MPTLCYQYRQSAVSQIRRHTHIKTMATKEIIIIIIIIIRG
jgi:hypothetical protein